MTDNIVQLSIDITVFSQTLSCVIVLCIYYNTKLTKLVAILVLSVICY